MLSSEREREREREIVDMLLKGNAVFVFSICQATTIKATLHDACFCILSHAYSGHLG